MVRNLIYTPMIIDYLLNQIIFLGFYGKYEIEL